VFQEPRKGEIQCVTELTFMGQRTTMWEPIHRRKANEAVKREGPSPMNRLPQQSGAVVVDGAAMP
jgi:hypothetical protein